MVGCPDRLAESTEYWDSRLKVLTLCCRLRQCGFKIVSASKGRLRWITSIRNMANSVSKETGACKVRPWSVMSWKASHLPSWKSLKALGALAVEEVLGCSFSAFLIFFVTRSQKLFRVLQIGEGGTCNVRVPLHIWGQSRGDASVHFWVECRVYYQQWQALGCQLCCQFWSTSWASCTPPLASWFLAPCVKLEISGTTQTPRTNGVVRLNLSSHFKVSLWHNRK